MSYDIEEQYDLGFAVCDEVDFTFLVSTNGGSPPSWVFPEGMATHRPKIFATLEEAIEMRDRIGDAEDYSVRYLCVSISERCD